MYGTTTSITFQIVFCKLLYYVLYVFFLSNLHIRSKLLADYYWV